MDAPPARRLWSVAATLLVLAAAVGYGYVRRAQARFEAGPRIALVQGNFTSSLKHDPSAWQEMFRTHWQLTEQAVKYQPDVIVWPETMFTWPLLERRDGLTEAERCRIQLEHRLARRCG